jgi:hypothetical protein
MKDYIREFPQADGSTMICEVRGGVRQPTRYVRPNGKEAEPAKPKKEPRRIEPKRTHQPKAKQSTPPVSRQDCAHILDPTGESVEQKNCGCPGNKMTSVWECELFGRVAPFAKGDPVDGVQACQRCGKYEKALPADTPGE